MKPINSDWYFIPLALLVIFMIALNESGYGVFALFLLARIFVKELSTRSSDGCEKKG